MRSWVIGPASGQIRQLMTSPQCQQLPKCHSNRDSPLPLCYTEHCTHVLKRSQINWCNLGLTLVAKGFVEAVVVLFLFLQDKTSNEMAQYAEYAWRRTDFRYANLHAIASLRLLCLTKKPTSRLVKSPWLIESLTLEVFEDATMSEVKVSYWFVVVFVSATNKYLFIDSSLAVFIVPTCREWIDLKRRAIVFKTKTRSQNTNAVF